MLEHWASERERKRVFFAILVCWSIWVFGCLPSAALWFHLLPHFFNGKQFTGFIHSFQWHILSLQYVCGKTLTELLWSFTLVVFFDCEIDIGAVWRLFLSVSICFYLFPPPVFVCFIWLYPVYMVTSVFICFICFHLFLSDTWFYLFYLFYQFLSVLSAIKNQDHLTFYFCLLTFDIWHDMILAQLLSNWKIMCQLVNNIGLIKISKNCKDCIRCLPIVFFVLFFMSKLSCLSSCSSPRPPPPSPSCPSPSQLSWTCAYCGPEIFFLFGQIQFAIWTNTIWNLDKYIFPISVTTTYLQLVAWMFNLIIS